MQEKIQALKNRVLKTQKQANEAKNEKLVLKEQIQKLKEQQDKISLKNAELSKQLSKA